MAYTQDQARQILASGQGSPEELSAANAAYYGAPSQGAQAGGGGFYGQQTQQPQQPMPGADNGALGYNNPGSPFYTPNQGAAPMAQNFAGASNDPGVYTTPDYIKNLNQNMMGWQANQGNAAGFSQGQFNNAWDQYMANPMQFNPDAYNQAMGITNANGTEKIYRGGQQVGNGQMAGQSGQSQYWGQPQPPSNQGQGPQAGGNGSGPAPNPQTPGGMGNFNPSSPMGLGVQQQAQGSMNNLSGALDYIRNNPQAQGSAPQTQQPWSWQGEGGQTMGSPTFNPSSGYSSAQNLPMGGTQSNSQYTGSGGSGQWTPGLNNPSNPYQQNPLNMPGNMSGVAQLGNNLRRPMGGYNYWGNPSTGNPFSYMTGQPGVRGTNSGPQQLGDSSFGQGSNQNFYNPVLIDHNVKG